MNYAANARFLFSVVYIILFYILFAFVFVCIYAWKLCRYLSCQWLRLSASHSGQRFFEINKYIHASLLYLPVHLRSYIYPYVYCLRYLLLSALSTYTLLYVIWVHVTERYVITYQQHLSHVKLFLIFCSVPLSVMLISSHDHMLKAQNFQLFRHMGQGHLELFR